MNAAPIGSEGIRGGPERGPLSSSELAEAAAAAAAAALATESSSGQGREAAAAAVEAEGASAALRLRPRRLKREKGSCAVGGVELVIFYVHGEPKRQQRTEGWEQTLSNSPDRTK